MRENDTYHRILNLIDGDCGLTLEQHHLLIAVISVNASKLLHKQKKKSTSPPSYAPNITMINCGSK